MQSESKLSRNKNKTKQKITTYNIKFLFNNNHKMIINPFHILIQNKIKREIKIK